MFKPQSFFFTEPSGMSQTAAQAFGSSQATPHIFRVTTGFQSTGGRAFALCMGTVLVQPQAGSSQLVNIVLRPFMQPINGLNIRYIVYRGLRKQDFFAGNLVKDSGAAESDFINKAQQSFANYYSNTEQAKPAFLAKFIGFDPENQVGTLEIDSFFFKQAGYTDEVEDEQSAFELPMVQAGDSLGYFRVGECGIDIVWGYGDYKMENPIDEFVFDLDYVRKAFAAIDVSGITDEYKVKRIKEQVQQFVDAAAFYGFHTANGTMTVYEGAAKVKKTGSQIYDTVVSKFFTKHRLYLYIQSDRGRSYNFYGNYYLSDVSDNNIRIGNRNESKTEYTYGSFGWPIHIVENVQTHSQAENEIHINLVTDSNPEAMHYVQAGTLLNATKNNFMDADGLRAPEHPDHMWVQDYTSDLILSNPATAGSSKHTVATFNNLVYEGVIFKYSLVDQSLNNDDAIIYRNFFDDIFDVNAVKSIYHDISNSKYFAVESPKFSLFTNYSYGKRVGISLVKTMVIFDEIEVDDFDSPVERAIFISQSLDKSGGTMSWLGKTSHFNKSIGASNTNVGTSEDFFALPLPYYYSTELFTDINQTITGLTLSSFDNSIIDKLLVGVLREELNMLKQKIYEQALINPRLVLVDIDGKFTSPEGISYFKYRLAIAAEDHAGTVQLHLPQEELLVYSIDMLYFFTKKFSDNMPEFKADYHLILPNQNL